MKKILLKLLIIVLFAQNANAQLLQNTRIVQKDSIRLGVGASLPVEHLTRFASFSASYGVGKNIEILLFGAFGTAVKKTGWMLEGRLRASVFEQKLNVSAGFYKEQYESGLRAQADYMLWRSAKITYFAGVLCETVLKKQEGYNQPFRLFVPLGFEYYFIRSISIAPYGKIGVISGSQTEVGAGLHLYF